MNSTGASVLSQTHLKLSGRTRVRVTFSDSVPEMRSEKKKERKEAIKKSTIIKCK